MEAWCGTNFIFRKAIKDEQSGISSIGDAVNSEKRVCLLSTVKSDVKTVRGKRYERTCGFLRRFDAHATYFGRADEGGLGPERPATLARDLDVRDSDTKTKSNPFDRDPRAGARPGKLITWQVSAIARITLLGPPAASLILLAVDYFEYWRAIPFNFADFLAAYLLFAIPVGYVFGAVPALLAASLYCALLTANPRLWQRRPLTGACVAALCRGLASGVWFWEQLRIGWGIYALVGALVMATLSLGTPQAAQEAHVVSLKDGSS